MRNRTLIVNADDYGRDEESTQAILDCFSHGFINQATLMVNMPYAETAVRRARELDVAGKIGLHLNLTQGWPLTAGIGAFHEICSDDGCFKAHSVGIAGTPLTAEMRLAIGEEVRAQTNRYLSFGLPLLHCDGHHHVHARLGLYPIVIPILRELGFRSVRNCYTVFGHFWRGVRGRMWKRSYERYVRRLGLFTTTAFGGWNGESCDKWRNFESAEIMVHPHYDASGDLVNVTDSSLKSGPRMEELCAHLS